MITVKDDESRVVIDKIQNVDLKKLKEYIDDDDKYKEIIEQGLYINSDPKASPSATAKKIYNYLLTAHTDVEGFPGSGAILEEFTKAMNLKNATTVVMAANRFKKKTVTNPIFNPINLSSFVSDYPIS
jgi:hypothetical protein